MKFVCDRINTPMRNVNPNDKIVINNNEYQIIKLLGHGKGGYSYLASSINGLVVIKMIHHEPCDYYQFGNKIEAELYDYERLFKAGIRIPRLLDFDKEQEIIIKEYITGPVIKELVDNNVNVEQYIELIQEMALLAKKANLNIDYYPTNFVVSNNQLFYIDYECNEYMEEYSFEVWGKKYWLD